jgi:hypothetical protein
MPRTKYVGVSRVIALTDIVFEGFNPGISLGNKWSSLDRTTNGSPHMVVVRTPQRPVAQPSISTQA